MDKKFSDKDKEFMQIAFKEAEKAFTGNNFPIGAVLVIDGKLIDKTGNSSLSSNKWAYHAETTLLIKDSALIKEKSMNGSKIDLYITLEPCLMCFGMAVHHRLSRIIYASPDPNLGATNIDPSSIKKSYLKLWPEIKGGLMKERACDLMIDFFNSGKKEEWKQEDLKLFENMRKTWK